MPVAVRDFRFRTVGPPRRIGSRWTPRPPRRKRSFPTASSAVRVQRRAGSGDSRDGPAGGGTLLWLADDALTATQGWSLAALRKRLRADAKIGFPRFKSKHRVVN